MVEPANVALPGYLRRVAGSASGRAYKDLSIDLLDPLPGQTVVDLGCGEGLDLPQLLDRVGPSGRVVGVDLDAKGLERARRAAPAAHLVHSDVAQVRDLDDSSADRVRTDRVLQHVAAPADVVREAARLLKPGGRAVFSEPDWHTLVIDTDLDAAEAFRQYVTNRVIPNAAVGRQLASISRESGLVVDHVEAFTAVHTAPHEADSIFGLQRVSERALDDGAMAPQAVADIKHVATAADCVVSVTVFLTVASKPV